MVRFIAPYQSEEGVILLRQEATADKFLPPLQEMGKMAMPRKSA